MRLLSGPFAGRGRHFVGVKVAESLKPLVLGESVNPGDLFASLTQHGWAWEVDYSEATEEEIFLWFRAELAGRAVRALLAGRSVFFLDAEYCVQEGNSPQEVAGLLEDDIVASGRLVTIDFDDERGLVIGVKGYEN